MSALRPFLPIDFVLEAGRFLLANPGPALIVTGFYILGAGASETDGPPGAAALGSALRSLGRDVAYVTDKFSKKVVEAVAEGETVIEFPVAGQSESEAYAAELICRFRPGLIIAVERAGLTGDGTYRNREEADISDNNAKTDGLFQGHPVSLGIGDGGNEIGMGNLRDEIISLEGLTANPCITTTSRLIVSSISNWGAYGLVAALSMLTGRILLPSVELGTARVRRCVAAGAVDGMTGERKDWVDGRSPEEDAFCLKALHEWLGRGPEPKILI
jgi:hypothetical protein